MYNLYSLCNLAGEVGASGGHWGAESLAQVSLFEPPGPQSAVLYSYVSPQAPKVLYCIPFWAPRHPKCCTAYHFWAPRAPKVLYRPAFFWGGVQVAQCAQFVQFLHLGWRGLGGWGGEPQAPKGLYCIPFWAPRLPKCCTVYPFAPPGPQRAVLSCILTGGCTVCAI